MSVASKLQLKPGQRVAILHQPDTVNLDVSADDRADEAAKANAVLLFATTRADVEGRDADAVVSAALQDKLTWIAYPKAGQLGTDLTRDSLAALLAERRVRAVRQVSIDDVWSALRFRPAG